MLQIQEVHWTTFRNFCQILRRNSPIPPADHQKQKRADVLGSCWHCGEWGHLRWNCPKWGRSCYPQERLPALEMAAVGSMVTVTGLMAGCQTEMLVNTGSVVTIVQEDVWKETLQSDWSRLVTSPQPAVATNCQELDLLGQSETVIYEGDLAKKYTVSIARGLVQECLLYADFFAKPPVCG